jgi:hypothetical protein
MAILIVGSLVHSSCSAEEPGGNVSSPAVQRPEVAQSRQGQEREMVQMIRIKAGDTILTARLEDGAAARDFAALLPLELTLKDYASTEKVADLPRKLSAEGAPAGIDPAVGDIAYYAPWGNLAIFYRDFDYSRGLLRLGRIESGAEELALLAGPVRIEAVK